MLWGAEEGGACGRKNVSSVPFGLVKICAFLVCFVHHYPVERQRHNPRLSEVRLLKSVCVTYVAYT